MAMVSGAEQMVWEMWDSDAVEAGWQSRALMVESRSAMASKGG
jgi:hypothetical protein